MSKVTAVYNGFVGHEGVPVLLHEGDEWDADDALVQAQPALFTEPPKRPSPRLPGQRGKSKDADD